MNNETVNRKYKDTVFRLLFKDKSNLLSLFNAVNDTDFSDENDIKITTLENAIYMTSKNDISCIIDMKLNLFEHQSTVNPNMPYRNLEYVTKCFKRYVGNFDIYSGKALTLPNPKFVVFYNGVNEQPPIRVMRLSDLYAHKDEIPNLELVVIQYNINNLVNCTLMERCEPLKEYSEFIGCIRSNLKTMDKGEAVDSAINYCIGNGILKDFLTNNRNEVRSMSLFEFDAEEHEKAIKQIAYEDGYDRGEEAGAIRGRTELILSMFNSGKTPEQISNFCGLDLKEVEKIIEQSDGNSLDN
ncbi:hypothetical protein [Eshraghiella crossota]|uniref:hypothetical protein n=1 Tax=Eshraghiella crossota TaxID=45851 RepID=UPI00402656CB